MRANISRCKPNYRVQTRSLLKSNCKLSPTCQCPSAFGIFANTFVFVCSKDLICCHCDYLTVQLLNTCWSEPVTPEMFWRLGNLHSLNGKHLGPVSSLPFNITKRQLDNWLYRAICQPKCYSSKFNQVILNSKERAYFWQKQNESIKQFTRLNCNIASPWKLFHSSAQSMKWKNK